MVIIGNDTQTQQTGNRKKDTQQDIKLDSLQSAIDTINAQMSGVLQDMLELNFKINNNYDRQTQTLMQALTSQIEALSASLENNIRTNQLTTVFANTTNLSVDYQASIRELSSNYATLRELIVSERARMEQADIERLHSEILEADTVNAVQGYFRQITTEFLSVADFTIGTLTATVINTEKITADEVEATEIGARTILGKEWQVPISTPDNTELLHISIPKYRGIVQIQTEGSEFNISIMNDSSVTMNQSDFYIYRIERNTNSIDVYLQNVGTQINYRLLHIGEKEYDSAYSELVEKTNYQQNIDQLQDVIFFESQDKIVKSEQIGYLLGLTESVQEQLNKKQSKILENPVELIGNSYYSVETLLTQISDVLNSMVTTDVVYRDDIEGLVFPYNSIQYDAETESIVIVGFHVEYIDGQLIITRI